MLLHLAAPSVILAMQAAGLGRAMAPNGLEGWRLLRALVLCATASWWQAP